MSIYKRGNTWWIRFTAPSGKRIRKSSQTGNRQKAQEFHDKLKAEYWNIQKLREKPDYNWQDAVVRWIKEKEHKADIQKDIQKFRWLNSYLVSYKLTEITRDRIEQIGTAKKDDSSSTTANRYLALIRSILRAARDDWEWIDRIPRVRLYPEPKKRIRFLMSFFTLNRPLISA